MTPLELMKDGILKNDMGKVSQAFTLITGEILKRPQAVATEVEVEQPQKVEKSRHNRGFDMEDFKTQITDRSKQEGRRQARSEPINLRKIKDVGNMFEDGGDMDANDAKARVKDKPLYVKEPVEKRPPPEKHKYRCSLCNDLYNLLPIHVALVKENDGIFICDDCKRKAR